MTVHLSLDAYLFFVINPKSLWWKQRNKYLCLYRPKVCWRISHAIHLRVFHTGEPQYKWARSRTLWYGKHIFSRVFLYYRVSKLLNSSSKGLTKVNNRMSRIKSTIESVSKAVSGTHSELVSRIARLKSHSGTLGKDTKSLAAKKSSNTNENLEFVLNSTSGANQDIPEDSASAKNHLFHISYLSTSFGETYNFVADHINWYFSNNSVMDQEKKRNALLQDSKSEAKLHSSENTVISEEKTVNSAAALAPETETQGAEKSNAALPVSTKKGIANFLSYPSNSVQAFVDSYIGGLVPKLRSDTKVAAQEKSKQLEQEGSEKDEEDEVKETKIAEEREKHLSLQREKIIARVSIDNRTRALVQALRRSSNRRVCISRVEELTYHLLEFPESRGVAIKERIIPCLLRLRQANDESLQAAVRETLAIIGYTDPVKGWGVRVLAIDGGGTRQLHIFVDADQQFCHLKSCWKSVLQLISKVCAVCEKCIFAFFFKAPECTGVVVYFVRKAFKSLFYICNCNFVLFTSYIVLSFIFNLQDGGLLLNNPSALAVHECKCLWPDVPLQCLVSLGTGRYESAGKTNVTYTSLKAKLTNVISSATDTEEVHTMLDALLPPDTYFRFNPLMNEDIPLDESRKEKLSQLQTDGIRYLERNEEKLRKAAKILTQEKSALQKFHDWIKLKADMYEGFPFLSKL
uniref:PLPL8 phospholipase n=1 Tax=Pavo cristatus TaxID=9049 RepID=A0A8C9FY22_PAVCR